MEHEPLFAHRRKVIKQAIKIQNASKGFSKKHMWNDFESQAIQKQNQQPQQSTPNKNVKKLYCGQRSTHKNRHKTVDLFEHVERSESITKNSVNITFSIDNLLERIQQLKSQFNQSKYSTIKKIQTTPFTLSQSPTKLKNNKINEKQIPEFGSLQLNKHVSENYQYRSKNYKKYEKQIDYLPIHQPLKFRDKVYSLRDNFSKINPKQQQCSKLTMSEFQLGKKIGQGKYGDVFLCRHKKTQSIYALKKIMKSTIKQYEMVDQFTNELKIHYLLVHPNVIKLYAHFQDEYHLFLLMQYAQGGSLMKRLKTAEDFTANTIEQVLQALHFMHGKNISHRDLKPQNIVLFFNNTIKICDFGWSKIFDNEMKMSRTLCGTPDYISPQMKDQGIYSFSVDLWSVGILTFQLLVGYPPFKKEIKQWVKKGTKQSYKWQWNSIEYPPQIKKECRNFISSLLKQNPQQRITIAQCLSHAFLKMHKTKNISPIMQQIQL